MDYSKISNIEIDGINPRDYPDFADAYILSADYDGEPMTEEQLNEINRDSDFVYEQVIKFIF